mmetsp:Transcript_27748/g.96035  ORF Transcript_27748/g.96035 Transcript_27748/m.96035 type:complete len:125 (-) Transcript_27748:98-472(-)
MHRRLSARGFEVLAFPCNQFGRQEPGTEEEIKSFVREHYGGPDFAMFAKIDVNGKNEHPLWAFLKQPPRDGNIKWNFEKFLVDRDGTVLRRYGPRVDPIKIEPDLVALLDRHDAEDAAEAATLA